MKPLDLLIVDDNQADQNTIKRYLEKIDLWHFNIRCSNNIAEAENALDNYLPELIILDQYLPGENGLDLLEKFQKQGCYIPVIMITGAGSESLASRAMREGAEDYIPKEDLSRETLETSIEHVMHDFHKNLEKNLKLLKLELEREKSTDELTGLHSRVALIEKIKKEINASRRSKKPLALLFIDIDNFKSVNDTKGHIVGDNVLKQVGITLSSCARNYDFVSRYGGDEFCILMPDTDLSAAGLFAKRILNELNTLFEKLFAEQNLTERLSASIGISEFDGAITKADDFIKQADKAMYKVKEKGGGGTASLQINCN
ncbi:MAG: diguanylate cyclase [bacterium]